jgi:phosphohistidine phosphatase
MRLYLVQHGEAISEEVDPQRPLTEKGSAEVSKMARFAQAAALKVALIWHSGKLRARQTADFLATTLQPEEGMRERGALAPNDPIEPVLEELEARQADLMIVGHLPFLAKLASMLLCGFLADMIAFRPGGILCLERGPDHRWRFGWMVTPELISKAFKPPQGQ